MLRAYHLGVPSYSVNSLICIRLVSSEEKKESETAVQRMLKRDIREASRRQKVREIHRAKFI